MRLPFEEYEARKVSFEPTELANLAWVSTDVKTHFTC